MLAVEPYRGSLGAHPWWTQTLRPGREVGMDGRDVHAIMCHSVQAPGALSEPDWADIVAKLRGLEGSAGPLSAIT
eukprot:8812162-Alexandrium_andersonii.AAC.1